MSIRTSLTRKQKTGAASHARGHTAEIIAAVFLFCKGYRIISLNRRTPFGEIDIVAAKGQALIAVEVKLRADTYLAGSALSPTQYERLLRALSHIAATQSRAAQHVRIDAILFVKNSLWPHHIINV